MPSSMAALVAETASLTLSCFSFISVSEAAPTSMTATPPVNLANLSSSFSLSNSEVVRSNSVLICLILPSMALLLPLPPTMTVLSLSEVTRSAWPKSSMVTSSSFLPTSSEITVPPVRMAMSSSISFLRSPKPGASTARTLKVPLSLFTTMVARASPSSSSATITRFLEVLTKFSKKGKSSWREEIFLSVKRR